MTPRQTLVTRMVRSYGCNPRDWEQEALVRDQAAILVSSLSDAQVQSHLRRIK